MADNTYIAILSLTEVINNYFGLSFNHDRKYAVNYEIAAKWAWKNIFRNTKWAAIHTPVQVNPAKPFTVWQQPKDTLRFLGVSYVDDCGNLQPIFQDPSMNITELLTLKRCGQDCLCGVVDSMTATEEDIIIDAVVYHKVITVKRNANGSITEYVSQPVKDYDDAGNYTVVVRETENTICQVETDEIGCIVPTEKNKTILYACGYCYEDSCIKTCQDGYQNEEKYCGRWKEKDGKIYIQTGKEQVILSRQTNGECEAEEMQIPEAAVDVMFLGIDHYTTAFNPKKNPYEKREAKRLFSAGKLDHIIFKDVFSLADFRDTQHIIPKW